MSSHGRTESKAEKERSKQIQDRCQALLTKMLRDDDNKYCVDCDAKGPRWASWNLGVFLCIRCAGIHRNLGVHISKVKSVNLDTWTPEQVTNLEQMGNSRARAVYEASLPDSWRRPQTDSNLEAFIRAKYQQKRYIAKEWVPPPIPKVDWNKELDEEAERLKKRKKEGQTSSLPPVRKIIPDTNVPALPKPTSSPKSSRTAAAAAPESNKKSAAIDLLGLSTGNAPVVTSSNGSDDAFSNFLSAPSEAPSVPQAANPPSSDLLEGKGRTAEEDSFFNQPAPAIEAKKPLSKDSIMALYSSQNAAPQQPSMFPAQGMFPANPMQFPLPGQNFSNGMNPGLGLQQGAAQPVSNPFFGMSMGMAPQQGFPVQHGSSSTKPSEELLADFSGLGTSNSLQQQMGTLNLNAQNPPMGVPNFGAMGGFPTNQFAAAPMQQPMGQTFTSHLWQ